MTTQILERQPHRTPSTPAWRDSENGAEPTATPRVESGISVLPEKFDVEAELPTLAVAPARFIVDKHELGRQIMQSATSQNRESFAVKCRAVRDANDFATPMRSMLLTLTSGFGGISATVSPSLNLHTWPAMDALIKALEDAGAGELWQPIGERSIVVVASRHIFVSADNPIRNDATNVYPNVIVEVVGAHLIEPEWFDRVVAPRCKDSALTFVFYGLAGISDSLFEREWHQSEYQGIV